MNQISSCAVCGKSNQTVFLASVPDRLEVVDQNFTYLKCQTCGLISLNPIPSFETTVSFYPKTFWRTDDENQKPSLLNRFETWFRNHLMLADFKIIRKYFQGAQTHLDVGCASGDFIVLCQKLTSVESLGIELSPETVEYCIRARKIKAVAGDLVTYDFGGKKFDVITYNGVLEHLPNPFEHLLKCKKLLNENGKVLISGLPNINSLGFRLAKKNWIGLDCPRHIYQFSANSLVEMLTKAGYRVESIDFMSPRFNPPSLIASLFPSLHRHKFDQTQKLTGRNPIVKKAILLVLLILVKPLDWVLSKIGMGEHINCVASVSRD